MFVVFFLPENEEYYRNYYKEAIRNAIAMVEEELKESSDRDKYLEPFRRFCSEETFFQSMVDMVAPREPLAVICHGDCWTNNFLFKVENGQIEGVSENTHVTLKNSLVISLHTGRLFLLLVDYYIYYTLSSYL